MEAHALEFHAPETADFWMCTLAHATPRADRYEVWRDGSRLFPKPLSDALGRQASTVA